MCTFVSVIDRCMSNDIATLVKSQSCIPWFSHLDTETPLGFIEIWYGLKYIAMLL